jgi:hypothetical protein
VSRSLAMGRAPQPAAQAASGRRASAYKVIAAPMAP